MIIFEEDDEKDSRGCEAVLQYSSCRQLQRQKGYLFGRFHPQGDSAVGIFSEFVIIRESQKKKKKKKNEGCSVPLFEKSRAMRNLVAIVTKRTSHAL